MNSSCFAEESITLTTYYPSPYGSYNDLSTQRLYVGSSPSVIAGSGAISFERRGSDPASAAISEGAIYYNSTDKEFKYSDGTGWAALGGGGSCYVDYGLAAGLLAGSACTAPGFVVKSSAGTWGLCYFQPSGFSHFRPAGAVCANLWGSGTHGEAYICCQ